LENSDSVEYRFRAGVRDHLAVLSDELTHVLRQLVEYPFPEEVQTLWFEVFLDGFTEEFPIRVFFLDADDNEYFVEKDGKSEYPCDVDPDLISTEGVFTREFEESFTKLDTQLDPFMTAFEEAVPWFSACWDRAGGANFEREASIGPHDDINRFDLKSKSWFTTEEETE
jgi:hypothetical protein